MIAVAHRARQFLDALHVREDGGEARPFLTPAQWALFVGQVPRDRKHALVCWRALAGEDESLRLAALLHDVGKGDVQPQERVLYVLLKAAAPWALARLAAPGGAHWRRALNALVHHAEGSAAAARQAGAPAAAVRLIRRHHERAAAEDRALRLLQRTDDRA
ncbi:MAG: HD domain-containing protein [Dehalococcoidia bacterium]|nr:HD domain-containing protein [Dehalococcoidia bacterium]